MCVKDAAYQPSCSIFTENGQPRRHWKERETSISQAESLSVTKCADDLVLVEGKRKLDRVVKTEEIQEWKYIQQVESNKNIMKIKTAANHCVKAGTNAGQSRYLGSLVTKKRSKTSAKRNQITHYHGKSAFTKKITFDKQFKLERSGRRC